MLCNHQVPPVDDSDDDITLPPLPASTGTAFAAADLESVLDLPGELVQQHDEEQQHANSQHTS
jgi:hypothetical protein